MAKDSHLGITVLDALMPEQEFEVVSLVVAHVTLELGVAVC